MTTLKTYLFCALLNVLAVSQPFAQSIVGSWTTGDTMTDGAFVLVFLPNGYYYEIENASAAEAPTGFDGFERGTYTWDAVTGSTTFRTLQDLNGTVGASSTNGSPLGFVVSGDSATLTSPTENLTLKRVRGASPIVGAWRLGNPAAADSSTVLVFLPNGVYFQAEDGVADAFGHDGMEHGTYTWNEVSGAFASTRRYADTNGEWGLSHTGGALTFTVSGDGLSLTGHVGAESFSFARIGGKATAPTTTKVVEYFNASLDHYFVTWVANEIALLDAGVTIKGWTRTGNSFNVYAVGHVGTTPICRYYLPPDKGNSHFYGRGTAECDATGQKNPTFVLEDPQFMQMFLPINGDCPASTTPIYRAFSNRPDANHRYMTTRAVRDEMTAKGWLAEGDGPDLVVMCSPV